MSRFRCAVVRGPGQLEVLEQDAPELRPGDVEISVAACGICGTNLHHLANPSAIPEPKRSCAGALGHEVTGHVTARGELVTGLEIGDAVVLEPQRSAGCNLCPPCRAGAPWFCEHPTPLRIWGFGERLIVAAGGAWRLPPHLNLATATLIEPLAVVVHALRLTARAIQNDGSLAKARVAVLGAGVTGLLGVVAARHLGAAEVIVTARYPHQAEAAGAFGASHVELDGSATEGRLRAFRPDVVLECVGGSAKTFELALRSVAPMGEVSVVGLFEGLQVVNTAHAFRNETRLSFPVAYSSIDGLHDYAIATGILAEREALFAPLITHRYALDDIAQAFAEAGDKRSGAFRVVVEPARTSTL